MAKKVLINNITAGSNKYFAGSEFDTVSDAALIATLTNAGGVLMPKEIPAIAAAQLLADSMRKRGGLAVEEAEIAALFDSALANAAMVQLVGGALVAGVLTINSGITVGPNTRALVILVTPAGTMGTNRKVALVQGGPGVGSVTVTSVDTAGVTVATDTSTLQVVLLG